MTTQELFAQVISKYNWYASLGYTRQYASNLKADFKSGKLSEEKQKEILLQLGYKIKSPLTWENSPITPKGE